MLETDPSSLQYLSNTPLNSPPPSDRTAVMTFPVVLQPRIMLTSISAASSFDCKQRTVANELNASVTIMAYILPVRLDTWKGPHRSTCSMGHVGSCSAGEWGFAVAFPRKNPLQDPMRAMSAGSTFVVTIPLRIAFAIVEGAVWASLLCSSSALARRAVIEVV